MPSSGAVRDAARVLHPSRASESRTPQELCETSRLTWTCFPAASRTGAVRRERRESEGLESAAGQAMGGHNGTCIVAGGPGERRGHWSGPHEAGSGCGARQLHPRHGFETVDADKPPPPLAFPSAHPKPKQDNAPPRRDTAQGLCANCGGRPVTRAALLRYSTARVATCDRRRRAGPVSWRRRRKGEAAGAAGREGLRGARA